MSKTVRKLTMKDLLEGHPDEITMEELYYNGFSGCFQNSEPKPGQIKIACVGDSITYGHGIYNWPEENYPMVLGKFLGDSYHVQSFGVCGSCVQDNSDQPYRQTERYQQSLTYDADIVIFMMGTNDSKPRNWHGVPAFRVALSRLLDSYLVEEKRPMIYLCLPATAFFAEGFTQPITKFDVQPEVVDTLCAVTREIAQERGYSIIDIHTLTSKNPQWFSADSVHPDNDGAAAIAQEIYSVLVNTDE